MEVDAFIKKMKTIYSALIDFIDATDDSDTKFKELIDVFEKKKISENQKDIQLLFQLISKIADNHYQTSDFFNKLLQVLKYLIKDTPSPISFLIPNYRQYNKRILFLLFEKKYVKPDEAFLNKYIEVYRLQSSYHKRYFDKLNYYLYPKIKEFLDEKVQKQFEGVILEILKEEITKFEEKCLIGENDSYICSLIRSDSVEEFIAYVNRTNLSLLTKIKPSIFETHSFLIDKEPTLIEYAAFFGSIQIITYLKYNKVPLTPSLCLYAIHSNNPQLIHFLEENKVWPEKNINDYHESNNKTDAYDLLIESIKCHHNDISNYIEVNFDEQVKANEKKNLSDTIYESLNFFFFPNEVESLICGFNNVTMELSQLCFSLTKITIPPSVKRIGFRAFSKCSSLTEIIIPSSVTSIGNYAFSRCSSLTQITIPSSVTSIGEYAFSGCSSLTQITIPSSVTSIGKYAFSGCSSLTQIIIPSSVTEIGNSAFSICSSLTQITIPSSVTSIGNNAFSGCSSLSQITIPSSVTSIGNSAFSGCSSLTQITIPSSVTSIGNNAFSKCSSLTQITIPSSVTSFGENIFNGVKSLEITGDIQRIPKILFSKCSSLTQITIPSSVISIDISSFEGCSSLTGISLPPLITEIGWNIFTGCSSLTQIIIPPSVTVIGSGAFSGCSSLTKIEIPSSVTKIGNYAFHNCSSLTQISIPSSVTSIGNATFYGCSSLSAESIESINRIQSSIKNDNIKNPEWVENVRNINIKPSLNSYSNTLNHNISSWATKSNNNSWINKTKPQKSKEKCTYSPWNPNTNIKSSWKGNNNSKLMNEFEIMKMLDHPNILKAVDIIYNDKNIPSILFEECPTNLNYAIQNNMLSKEQLASSIIQIEEGMKYVHSCKIIHLNLKPTCILISKNGTIKIGGFEKAEKMLSEKETRQFDDVYSFGEIVYFILSGREINNSEKEAVIQSFPLFARQLIEACFCNDLERRPTFEIICDILKNNDLNSLSN